MKLNQSFKTETRVDDEGYYLIIQPDHADTQMVFLSPDQVRMIATEMQSRLEELERAWVGPVEEKA